ncbi:hypothetical protein RhiXN_09144 [Rhizoctonia solani]|uniref:Uncharacterized protein n=1 Tax=Rhizoctonia solani TaxID=456999 RepID=A0A8H8SW47_9AGAM|nr:uncharacterized protein RhiXN_09144 [Rhizoctonia solani]QRW20169.1 hypothetical protein RhiXN_09144 [Rhizoctonia solani]
MSKKPPKALSSRRQVMFEPVYPVPQFRSPDVHPLTLRRPGYHSLPEPFPREHTDSRPSSALSVYEGRRSHAAETLQSSPDSDRDHASCVLRAPEISTLNLHIILVYRLDLIQ